MTIEELTDRNGRELKTARALLNIKLCQIGTVVDIHESSEAGVLTMPYKTGVYWAYDDCLVLPTVEIDGEWWCTDASLMPENMCVEVVYVDDVSELCVRIGNYIYPVRESWYHLPGSITRWRPATPTMPEVVK